jgi:iron complex transport system ATP-binding protein
MNAHVAPAVTPGLEARGLGFAYGERPVLRDLGFRVQSGCLTAVVGANGSGKSTLFALLGRLQAPLAGAVLLDGEPIGRPSGMSVARHLAILPQHPVAPEGITAFDLVARGRHPHHRLFNRWSAADAEAVERAMALTDTLAFADRRLEDLSGGQRQRCWIALTLAQETDILLLDEPTAALDLHYQLEIVELLARLAHQHGRTVVVVLHDLNLAAAHADRMVFLKDGTLLADGPTEAVCTAEIIEAAFGVAVHRLVHPETGRPVFTARAR